MKRYFVRFKDSDIRGPWTLSEIHERCALGELPPSSQILLANSQSFGELTSSTEWQALPAAADYEPRFEEARKAEQSSLSPVRRWVLVIAPLLLCLVSGSWLLTLAALASLILAWCLFPPQEEA